MQKLNFHLTGPQYDKLKRISQDTGLSLAELLRRAVDCYLKSEET